MRVCCKSEELGGVDNTQVLSSFIISNVSAHLGVVFGEKIDYNTTLRVGHSQIGRNAVIHTLNGKTTKFTNIDSQFP